MPPRSVPPGYDSDLYMHSVPRYPHTVCSWLLRSLDGCHRIYECLCSGKCCYLMSTPKHKNSDAGHVDKTKKGHRVFHLRKNRKVLTVKTDKGHLLALRSSRKKEAISLWGNHKEGKRNVCWLCPWEKKKPTDMVSLVPMKKTLTFLHFPWLWAPIGGNLGTDSPRIRIDHCLLNFPNFW